VIIGDARLARRHRARRIINQKGGDMICIMSRSGRALYRGQVVKTLQDFGAMGTPSWFGLGIRPGAYAYIAPFSGTAMGEYFRDTKRHALCIYDDPPSTLRLS